MDHKHFHHHRHDHFCERNNGLRKLIFGVIILAVGLIFLFDNLGILPLGLKSVLISWQMLLIAIGLVNLSSRHGSVMGIILIMIGVFFLLPEIIFFSFDFARLFWPFLMIMLGLIIIFRRRIDPKIYIGQQNILTDTDTNTQTNAASGDDFIDDLCIFGGRKHQIISNNFKGGKITAIFGGSEIDLSHSQLGEGKNVLEIIAIFGGASIIVPNNWNVRVEIVSALGGFADNRIINAEAFVANKNRELIIKGVAIFGGGEIKSY